MPIADITIRAMAIETGMDSNTKKVARMLSKNSANTAIIKTKAMSSEYATVDTAFCIKSA